MNVKIHPSTLTGAIILPSSKSQTLRALFFASFATTSSKIFHPLLSDDSNSMIDCLKKLGAKFSQTKQMLFIDPIPLPFSSVKEPLFVGNSGITFRFLTAIGCLFPEGIIIDGDDSIRTLRPINALLLSLEELGIETKKLSSTQTPLKISGQIKKSSCSIDSKDSQPITALLYLSVIAKKNLLIKTKNCEEKPWLNLSLSWLHRLGIPVKKSEDTYQIFPQLGYCGFNYETPGDLSSMAFFVVLSIIQKKPITINRVDLTDLQPDGILIKILENIGVPFLYNQDTKVLKLNPKDPYLGFTFDLELGIDLLPILSVLGCFLTTPTHLYNGKIARNKESDRISCICLELKKMGAKIDEFEDGLMIYPSVLHGATVYSHKDHRIAMSLAIAATKATSETIIEDVDCFRKTFPDFFSYLKNLGAKIDE